jgi:hypothetical protein
MTEGCRDDILDRMEVASGACPLACRRVRGTHECSGAGAAGLQRLGRDARHRQGHRTPRCRNRSRGLHPPRRRSRNAAGDLCLQWRPRRRQHLPPSLGHRTEDDRNGRGMAAFPRCPHACRRTPTVGSVSRIWSSSTRSAPNTPGCCPDPMASSSTRRPITGLPAIWTSSQCSSANG